MSVCECGKHYERPRREQPCVTPKWSLCLSCHLWKGCRCRHGLRRYRYEFLIIPYIACFLASSHGAVEAMSTTVASVPKVPPPSTLLPFTPQSISTPTTYSSSYDAFPSSYESSPHSITHHSSSSFSLIHTLSPVLDPSISIPPPTQDQHIRRTLPFGHPSSPKNSSVTFRSQYAFTTPSPLQPTDSSPLSFGVHNTSTTPSSYALVFAPASKSYTEEKLGKLLMDGGSTPRSREGSTPFSTATFSFSPSPSSSPRPVFGVTSSPCVGAPPCTRNESNRALGTHPMKASNEPRFSQSRPAEEAVIASSRGDTQRSSHSLFRNESNEPLTSESLSNASFPLSDSHSSLNNRKNEKQENRKSEKQELPPKSLQPITCEDLDILGYVCNTSSGDDLFYQNDSYSPTDDFTLTSPLLPFEFDLLDEDTLLELCLLIYNRTKRWEVICPRLTKGHHAKKTLEGRRVPSRASLAAGEWPRILGFSLIFVVGVVGNVLVVVTLLHHRNLRTVTNVFLLNLAVSDLLLGVFCMPFTLVGSILQDFVFGALMCRLIPYMQAVSVSVSVWTLVAISLERFYAICQPLRSRRWQTPSHSYRVIAVVWAISLFCMLPIAALSTLMPVRGDPGRHKCREVWPSLGIERTFTVLLTASLLLVPLVVMVAAYLRVVRTLWLGGEVQRYSSRSRASQQGVGSVADISSLSRSQSNLGRFSVRFRKMPPRTWIGEAYPEGERQGNGSSPSLHRHCQGLETPPETPVALGGLEEGGAEDLDSLQGGRSRKRRWWQRGSSGSSSNRSRAESPDGTAWRSLRSSQTERSLLAKRRVVRMLFVLVAEFFICWTPLFIVNLLSLYIPRQVYAVLGSFGVSLVQLLAYLSSCCNPITYCFMNAKFLQSFKQTFGCANRRSHSFPSANASSFRSVGGYVQTPLKLAVGSPVAGPGRRRQGLHDNQRLQSLHASCLQRQHSLRHSPAVAVGHDVLRNGLSPKADDTSSF